jgi:DNA-binding transcriptional regulator YiaG
MDIPNEIKLIRHKAFLTQEDFAKSLNVAFSTVNRWESGKTTPSMSAMKQIKAFCENNNLSFDTLEEAWLSNTQGEETK